MNRLNSFEVALALLGAISAASCGPVGPGKSPSPRFRQAVQNSEGCLDLPKLLTAAGAAKRLATGTTDVIVVADAKPMSKNFEFYLYMMGKSSNSAPDPEHQEKEAKEFAEAAKQVTQ